MNGISYENYCAQWLKRNGYHNIQLTKASRDQGIDILATKRGKLYGFQCKYYSSTVGNDAVQQAFSGTAYYGCDIACVITNTNFSKDAIELAEETDVLLFPNIDPDADSLLHQFYNIFLILFICIGVVLLFYESRLTQYNDTIVLATVSLILSSILAFFTNANIIIAYLSSLFSLFSLLLFYKENLQNIWLIILLFFHLSLDYKLMRNTFKNKKKKKEDFQIENQQKAEQQGKDIAEILKDEFHTNITWHKSTIQAQTTIHTFHSTKDLSQDFALMEYSFQQYASYHQIQKTCSFMKLSPKSFTVTIKDK